MSAESHLFAILNADTSLESLVSDRIYPDVLPESTLYPAVVYSRTGSDPLVTIHADPYQGDFVTLTLQCWAPSRADAVAVDDAIAMALFSAGEVPTGSQAIYDEEFDLYGMERSVTLFQAP